MGWLGTDRGDSDQGLELLFESSGIVHQKLIDAGPLAIRCFGGHWQAPLIQTIDEAVRKMRVGWNDYNKTPRKNLDVGQEGRRNRPGLAHRTTNQRTG
jgi:hypothetical protein